MAENFAADIPADLAEADQTLTRYGRWATTRGRSIPHTVDRMYIREADGRATYDDIQQRRAPVDPMMTTQDALNAQRALARVPDQERVVLAILYVPQRMPVAVQLRILRIPPALCRARHIHGLRMFRNILRVSGR